jgi:hypothetical protein
MVENGSADIESVPQLNYKNNYKGLRNLEKLANLKSSSKFDFHLFKQQHGYQSEEDTCSPIDRPRGDSEYSTIFDASDGFGDEGLEPNGPQLQKIMELSDAESPPKSPEYTLNQIKKKVHTEESK